MKNLYLLILVTLSPIFIFSQETKPEIKGKLSTGELLTGVYPSGSFIFGNSYLWHTATDALGTLGLEEVGKSRTYTLKQADAGKYIRFQLTTFNRIGRRETFYSDWAGPIKYGIPLIQGTITISGTIKAGVTVTANYVYNVNNYPESGSTFNWYQADNTAGLNAVLIASSGSSFLLPDNTEAKYIRVEVIPRDTEGSTGSSYTSSWTGPVLKPDPPANRPPVASNVRIRGVQVLCAMLTGIYDYSDPDQDLEGESSFRWLRLTTAGGTPAPIPDATTNTYTITEADKNSYIYFEVTPKAVTGLGNVTAVTSSPTNLIQNTLPTVTFSGNTSICKGANTNISITFTGTPPFNLEYSNGSTNYSLSTTNYVYQLAVNTSGTYKGTKLTDNQNCPVTNLPSSAVISLKPHPILDFTPANTCFTSDSTLFKNTSTSKTTLKNWSWNFGDPNSSAAQNVSTIESPKHKYASGGNFSVKLSAENTDGCKDTLIKTIQLGEMPMADLSWDKECFDVSKATNFQNSGSSKDNISKYAWSIKNSSGKLMKESVTSGFSYTIPAMGNYTVKLKITTELGCSDSIAKSLSPKPIYNLKDSSYADNFEKGKSWNIESISKNSWFWGDPEGTTVSSAFSGSHAYYTSFPEKRRNQQLIVTSPCFSFTNIQKPFIELRINYANQEAKEGAVLQYTQDGESTWTNAGNINSGLNWYNNNNIGAKPANQLTGWSGNSAGWKQSRQSLDLLSNKTNVRFRIVYATSSDATVADGFAFDDVFIGQRGKKVLIEHFTNLSDAFATRSNLSVDSVLSSAGLNAIGIQYHTSFPGQDSLNDQNKANPAARALFYGIGNIPISYLDGGLIPNYVYDFKTRKLNISDVNLRSLDDPQYDIKVSSAITNNVLSGTVKITALKDLATYDNTLYIAVVEDINIQVAGKAIVLNNVLKFIYPSSAGTPVINNMLKDQLWEVPFSWPLKSVYNLYKLKVVAFVQNSRTKEVYQVDMAKNSTVTSAHEIKKDKSDNIIIYPNPANNLVNITFGEELTTDSYLQILNLQGKIINIVSIKKGNSIIELSVSDFPAGLYYIKISNKIGETKTGKLIIRK